MNGLVEWAEARPMFTLNAAERATGMNRASLREKLSRLTQRGDLHRIERGKYTVHTDPLIYATYIETPSYLSLWSGLRYYNRTTQQPTTIQVMTATNRTDLTDISFYYTSQMFGFRKQRYDQFDIFVADEERLLIDCLARREVPVSALTELLETINMERATAYANRLGRNSVKKRLGYLLETTRGETIEDLRVNDRNYPVLDLTRPADGETDTGWRLTLNTNAR